MTVAMNIKPTDLLGTQETAELMGLRRQNFLRDHAKRPDFPKPFVVLAATPVWVRADVQRYLSGWRKGKRP